MFSLRPFEPHLLLEYQKEHHPKGWCSFWCERWDSNPHGETTRTSNVLVYHSNTLASAIVLYVLKQNLSTPFFGLQGFSSSGWDAWKYRNREHRRRPLRYIIRRQGRLFGGYPWVSVGHPGQEDCPSECGRRAFCRSAWRRHRESDFPDR